MKLPRTSSSFEMGLRQEQEQFAQVHRLVAMVIFGILGTATVTEGLNATFNCKTMLPDGRYRSESQNMIPLALNIGENNVASIQYTPGKELKVELKATRGSVADCFCRASQLMMDAPIGFWVVFGIELEPTTCLKKDDALRLSNKKTMEEGTTLLAYWTPPSTPGYGDVEFVCSVVDTNHRFGILNSIIINEAEI